MSDVQTTKLKVDFLNPRSGNKPASIKADGKYWSVTDEDYPKIKQGETYHFTYKAKAGTGPWAGRTFLDITGIIASDSSGGNGHAATAPAPATGNGHAAPANKDLVIWVECILGRVWKDKIPVGDTTALIQAGQSAIEAYQVLFCRGSGGDDIPF